MDPSADTAPTPADSGELLSAYLAGELPDDAAAALEARLAEDPALRDQLEAQREVQEALAASAAPDAPEGAGTRLRERLARERAALGAAAIDAGPAGSAAGPVGESAPPGHEGAPADAEAAPPPDSLDAARARRRSGGISWAAVGSVAAALVAVAVVGAGALGGFGQQDDMAAPDSAREFLDAEDETVEETAEGDGGMDAMAAPEDDGATLEAEEGTDAAGSTELESAPEARGPAGPPVEPVIADDGVVLADEQEVREHLGDRPEATGLLGLSGEDAREVAAAFSVAVRSAEPFADGTRPDACLDTVTDGAGDAAVPARVESVLHEGTPALAYLLAAAPDGQTIDRIEAWIVEPTTCATRLYLVLGP